MAHLKKPFLLKQNPPDCGVFLNVCCAFDAVEIKTWFIYNLFAPIYTVFLAFLKKIYRICVAG